MVCVTVRRSLFITVCLLLGLIAFGSAQSGKRGQQAPRGVTVISPTSATPILVAPSPPPVAASSLSGIPSRQALVIGNTNYLQKPLLNPINDATVIANFLAKEAGFQVYKGRALMDIDMKMFVSTISDFANSIRRGDTVVFCFSGHGLERNGQNYLIPINFAAQNAAQLPYEAPTAQDVQKQLAAGEPGMMIIILDACRDLPDGFKSLRGRAGGDGLGFMSAVSGSMTQQVIMFATAPGTTASDGGTLGNGTFTYCFLQSFQRPNIDSRIAFGDVVQCVLDQSNQEQRPFLVTSQTQSFVFKQSMGPLQPVPPVVGEINPTPPQEPRLRPPVQVEIIEDPKPPPPVEPPPVRTSVEVPRATREGQHSVALGRKYWARAVPAFLLDLRPVSNQEFLHFVQTFEEGRWKRSQIDKKLHDGDYLKHWSSDETVPSKEQGRPVRYISYFAAEAYCRFVKKKLPILDQYRAATNVIAGGDITYKDKAYKPLEFNLMHTEWTDTSCPELSSADPPDLGKHIRYQHHARHTCDPKDREYAAIDKKYTGKSLGSRCVEYSQKPSLPLTYESSEQR